MMTFKQFYLQSSKGDKAPPRASWTSKTPKRQNEILERIRKLKAAKFRSRRISEITR
jgi:hypothetical protein